jgi:uncharacterized RmlC-like cupin family protein
MKYVVEMGLCDMIYIPSFIFHSECRINKGLAVGVAQ